MQIINISQEVDILDTTKADNENLTPNELKDLDAFIEEKGMGAYSHALRFFFETGMRSWKETHK